LSVPSSGLFEINTEGFQQLCFRHDRRNATPEDYYWLTFFTDNSSLFAATGKGFLFLRILRKSYSGIFFK
jgi:hypothetical protein